MLTDKPDMPLILVVEDDDNHIELIQRSFKDASEEYRLETVCSLDAAQEVAGRCPPALVLTDYRLPDGDGGKLVAVSAGAWPVILMTSHGNEQVAVEAMKSGAQDYIVKSPESFAALPRIIERTLREWSTMVLRKKAEEALRESVERFAVAFNNAPVMITISSLEDGTYLDVNQRFTDISGFSREEAIGMTSVELGWITGAERNKLLEMMRVDGKIQDLELGLRTKSGRAVLCKYWGDIITVSGRKCLLSIALDITEHRKVEQQFLQAQKMESVGRLAGGVAHDFNNMLGVIIGHAELALMKSDPSNPLRHDLEAILEAANRSADITRQLLAFARRQTITPKVLDLNDMVAGMLKMLRRLIGEDIELGWNPGYELWKVKIDPSQLDQILANLCVNARDAIAGVGKIDIQTENLLLDATGSDGHTDMEPGAYVMLSVSDNGSGMEKDVVDHIFEPFYTTKELGHGTGLGLATVFGIVSQNGGHIRVYSEPGLGTTFKIYLPGEMGASGDTAKEAYVLVGGTESILLVEDEPSILAMGTTMLTSMGYTVHPAGSPEEARRIGEEYRGRIDLLITDIIMPGMNGRDLAEQLLLENPGMSCLFMSGYTADVMAERGRIHGDVHFMQKPFTMQSLTQKVREALKNR